MNDIYIYFGQHSEWFCALFAGITTIIGTVTNFKTKVAGKERLNKYGWFVIILTITGLIVTLWFGYKGEILIERNNALRSTIVKSNDLEFEFLFKIPLNANIEEIKKALDDEIYLVNCQLGHNTEGLKFDLEMKLMSTFVNPSRRGKTTYFVYKSKNIELDNWSDDVYLHALNGKPVTIQFPKNVTEIISKYTVDNRQSIFKMGIRNFEIRGSLDNNVLNFKIPNMAFNDFNTNN